MRFLSMSTLPKSGWVMALLVASIHLATSTKALAAKHTIPFKGAFEAVEFYDYQLPTLFVDGSGSGVATHLGRFVVIYEHVVDLTTLAGTGSAQFIAANGDRLFTEATGQANPTDDPDVAYVEESFTIVGGTGRFANATGEFQVRRLLNTVTGATSGSLKGTIDKKH